MLDPKKGITFLTKWTPLILIVITLIVVILFFFANSGVNLYVPQTDNAAIMYQEACASCHGENGQGARFYLPGLLDFDDSKEKIIHIVRNGTIRMP